MGWHYRETCYSPKKTVSAQDMENCDACETRGCDRLVGNDRDLRDRGVRPLLIYDKEELSSVVLEEYLEYDNNI